MNRILGHTLTHQKALDKYQILCKFTVRLWKCRYVELRCKGKRPGLNVPTVFNKEYQNMLTQTNKTLCIDKNGKIEKDIAWGGIETKKKGKTGHVIRDKRQILLSGKTSSRVLPGSSWLPLFSGCSAPRSHHQNIASAYLATRRLLKIRTGVCGKSSGSSDEGKSRLAGCPLFDLRDIPAPLV